MLSLNHAILQAENRIRPYVRETPLNFSLPYSELTAANVYLKCENLQHTGSFKPRGAFNKLLCLTSAQRQQGVVAASSGNHGTGVAFGAYHLKIPARVFVPENTSAAKIDNIRRYHASLEFHATDCMMTELYANEYAQRYGMVYISPYDDMEIIAGQGTIAVEIARQLEKIDVVLVPIGGGGLIAGIASYLKAVSAKTKIIGCLPENSPVMAASVTAGKIIEMPTLPTLSDATAGGIVPKAITFEMCQQLVDDYILVSEAEIKQAILYMLKKHYLLIEGAAGVALGALLKQSMEFKNKNVVVILSGGNVSFSTLKGLLD